MQQTKLPTMNESDEVDVLVSQLEIALKSAGIPRSRWKHNLLTQLTLTAKEPIEALLDDETVGYEEVKEALVSRR